MFLSTADWIILVTYLALITILGVVVGLKVRDTEHYFLGKRKFGKWLMIGQSFGVGTHAEMPVSLAGAVYSVGISGIWFQWKNLFVTPFYWIMAPIFRRIRRTTVAELTSDRYGAGMAVIYTAFALGFLMINTAGMLKGAAKVINQAVGGGLGVNRIVIAMTVIFILYSFIGGLVAAAWTDFVQGFLIIALSFMLVPLGWEVVGGMAGMKEALDTHMFSLATPAGLGFWFIFVLTLNGLVGIMAMPHILAAVGTGKDERTCRVGFFFGNFVKRICTVGWGLVGLITAAVVAKETFGVSSLADTEDAFGFACRHLLFPGSIGLLIAAIMAANMSSCSAFMVNSGALFTQNLYRPYLSRHTSDRHYLWIGRISGLLITLTAVIYAIFLIDKVLYAFLLSETMATYMGISILGGILWRRANRWGALSSLAVAMTANFGLYYVRDDRLDHWDPNVFFLSLVAGATTLVLVSLLTRPEAREETSSFFGRLESPTDLAKGATSLDAAAEGKQLLLLNLGNLRKGALGRGFLRAYREDLVGFCLGWGLVILLVTLTWLLLQT
jgi:Na+/proline symporter